MAVFSNLNLGLVTECIASLENEEMDGGLLSYMIHTIFYSSDNITSISESTYFQWLGLLLVSPVTYNDPNHILNDKEYSRPNPYHRFFIISLIFALILPLLVYIGIVIGWFYVGKNDSQHLHFKVCVGSVKYRLRRWTAGVLRSRVRRKVKHSLRRYANRLYQTLNPNSKVMPLTVMQSCIHVIIILLIALVTLSLIAFILLTTLVVFPYNQLSAESLSSNNNSESISTTLSESLDSIVDYVQNNFVTENRDIWDFHLKTIKTKIKVELNITVNEFIEKLLYESGITQLMKQTESLGNLFNKILHSVTYIDKNLQKMSSDYSEFKGAFQYLKSQLLSILNDVCRGSVDSIDNAKCWNYRNELSNTNTPINFDKINLDSIQSLLAFLGNQNLTDLTSQLLSSSSLFDKEIAKVYSQIGDKFNLDTIFDSASKVWTTFDELIEEAALKNVSRSINGGVADSMSTVYVYFVGSSVILTVMIYTILGFAVVLLIISAKFFTEMKKTNSYYEEFSKPTMKLSLYQSHSRHWKSGLVACGILLFLPTIFGTFCFLLGSSTETELCRYLTDKEARDILDQRMNVLLVDIWPTVDLADFKDNTIFSFPMPLNLVQTFLVNCKSSVDKPQPRLLAEMNVSSIVNVSLLLNGPQMRSALATGRNEMLKMVDTLSDPNLLTDYEKLRKDTLFITKTLDSEDYSIAISELSKPLVNISSYHDFITNMFTSLKLFSDRNPTDSNLKIAISYSKVLHDDLPIYSELLTRKELFKRHYETLHNNRNVTFYTEDFFDFYEHVKKTLSDSKFMKELASTTFDTESVNLKYRLNVVLESAIRMLQNDLLPCDIVEKKLQSVLVKICGYQGVTNFFSAFGISWLFSILLLHIILIILIMLMHLSTYYTNEQNVSVC